MRVVIPTEVPVIPSADKWDPEFIAVILNEVKNLNPSTFIIPPTSLIVSP